MSSNALLRLPVTCTHLMNGYFSDTSPPCHVMPFSFCCHLHTSGDCLLHWHFTTTLSSNALPCPHVTCTYLVIGYFTDSSPPYHALLSPAHSDSDWLLYCHFTTILSCNGLPHRHLHTFTDLVISYATYLQFTITFLCNTLPNSYLNTFRVVTKLAAHHLVK